jgi:hypothetical protein
VLQGVHEYEPGHVLDAVLDPENLFVFDACRPPGRGAEQSMREMRHGTH